MVEDKAGYVALALTPGIGHRRLTTLLQCFGSPDRVFSAPFEAVARLNGMTPAAATAVSLARPESGRRVLDRVEALGGHCLTPGDPGFPTLLQNIPEPPTLLFTLGRPELLRSPMVAIVGSRDHSDYGAEVCDALARAVAQAGLVVVSGMARGLDAVGQRAALEAGGGTVGVLGNGFGVVYPAANRALYERVALEGLMVTEFPPGERPQIGSFPRRNRLISGLARVTVVIEAAAGSGTLITVEAALGQGREVMAVPGAITSPTSVGTNRLIRDGATPLLEVADLLAFYPEAVDSAATSGGPLDAGRATPQRFIETLEGPARLICGALQTGPLHLDDIVLTAELPVGTVLAELCSLELGGIVEQLPGRVFKVKGADA